MAQFEQETQITKPEVKAYQENLGRGVSALAHVIQDTWGANTKLTNSPDEDLLARYAKQFEGEKVSEREKKTIRAKFPKEEADFVIENLRFLQDVSKVIGRGGVEYIIKNRDAFKGNDSDRNIDQEDIQRFKKHLQKK